MARRDACEDPRPEKAEHYTVGRLRKTALNRKEGMDHRTRAGILWQHLQMPRVKGNREQEIECIIDALIDGAADALSAKGGPTLLETLDAEGLAQLLKLIGGPVEKKP
jgi:hypothetical protein